MNYHGFGGKLHHVVPSWVASDAMFHIRIGCALTNKIALTHPPQASDLIDSVKLYESRGIWYPVLWLLMPDHIHALLVFSSDKGMSRSIGDWKRYQTKKHDIEWQEGFFDHRIRDDEQLGLKFDYILNNPVVNGLCAEPGEWPWVYAAKYNGQR